MSKEKKGLLRRLAVANLIAALVLVLLAVAALAVLGLLGSLFAFIF